jgi:serine/threonine protein kinase
MNLFYWNKNTNDFHRESTDPKYIVSLQTASSYLRNEPIFSSRINDIYTQVCQLKENEFLHVIKGKEGTLIGKIGGKWVAEPIVDHAKGGCAQVELTNSVALRILSGSRKQQKQISEKEKILSKRTNTKDPIIGITPPPLGFVKKVYDITTGSSKEYPTEYTINKRFKGDLLTCNFSKEEALTICSHIALGIKTLHEANLHHLDIKPSNILYEDNGIAYLSDFDGIVKSDWSDFFLPNSLLHTPVMVLEKDLVRLRSAWCFSQIAKQMDIFALGSTFYQIACKATKKNKSFSLNIFSLVSYFYETLYSFYQKILRTLGLKNDYPYSFKNGYARSLLPRQTLIDSMKSVYSDTQINMILRMLDKDGDKRPSIQEVVKVFPLELKI